MLALHFLSASAKQGMATGLLRKHKGQLLQYVHQGFGL